MNAGSKNSILGLRIFSVWGAIALPNAEKINLAPQLFLQPPLPRAYMLAYTYRLMKYKLKKLLTQKGETIF